MINAGELRHRVELQKPNPQSSRDEKGQRITTFDTMATVWAKVAPLQGREQFIAAQMQASTTHIVTVRHSSITDQMTSAWRVKWGERVFVLDGPPRNIDEADVRVEIFCTEGPRKQ